MRRLIKVALLIGGCFLLAIVLLVDGAKFFGDRFAARMEAVNAEATAFARGHRSPDCVDEAVRRLGNDADLSAATRATLFLQMCLPVAEVPDGYCAGVPAPSSVMIGDAIRWNDEQCARYHLEGNARCQGLMQVVRGFCHPR